MESDPTLKVIAADRSVFEHLRAIWQYRELLTGLVRKELKVKYQDSSLGFLWSMLNPAMYLAVFYIVFAVILDSGIPNFAVYLLSGLLLWNVFSISVSTAVTVIVGNGSLVNKVYFPREILPLATVGANLIHFFLQSGVLVAALVIFRYDFGGIGYLALIPFAIVTVVVFTSALAILFSALNVYARDLQHLLELVMLAWFWLTPVVYPWGLAANQLDARGASSSLLLLNPMVSPILVFQRAIYGVVVGGNPPTQVLPDASVLWYLRNVLVVLAASSALLLVAVRIFGKLESSFAEEL